MESVSDALHHEFNENGYVIVDNLFDENTYQKLASAAYLLTIDKMNLIEKDIKNDLSDIFEFICNKPNYPIANTNNRYLSRSHLDCRADKLIDTIATNLIAADIPERLLGHKAKRADFKGYISLIPEDTVRGINNLHQDYPLDHDVNDLVMCWCPITPVDKANFRIIPGTHKLGALPQEVFGQFKQLPPNITEQLKDRIKTVEVKLGQAIIFNTKTVHSLEKNFTSKTNWSFFVSFEKDFN